MDAQRIFMLRVHAVNKTQYLIASLMSLWTPFPVPYILRYMFGSNNARLRPHNSPPRNAALSSRHRSWPGWRETLQRSRH